MKLERREEQFGSSRRDTRNRFRLADSSRHPSAKEFPSKNSNNKSRYYALVKGNQAGNLAKANSSLGKQANERESAKNQLVDDYHSGDGAHGA